MDKLTEMSAGARKVAELRAKMDITKSWTTARRQYWKAMAELYPGDFSPEDLARMKKGLAPRRINPRSGKAESKELHHKKPQREKGSHDPANLNEVWPDEHQQEDIYRRLWKASDK